MIHCSRSQQSGSTLIGLSPWSQDLLVVTSEIHLPRTRAIFEWASDLAARAYSALLQTAEVCMPCIQIFSLPPHRRAMPRLSFEAVSETGTLSSDQRESRALKEQQVG